VFHLYLTERRGKDNQFCSRGRLQQQSGSEDLLAGDFLQVLNEAEDDDDHRSRHTDEEQRFKCAHEDVQDWGHLVLSVGPGHIKKM
jgi:hypothetical protein